MSMIVEAVKAVRNKIMTMIQRTIVTLSSPVVPGEYPTAQIKGLGVSVNEVGKIVGSVSEVENISPYGLASTLPIGALGVKFNIQGESANAVGFSYDPVSLPALNAGGEVAVGNLKIGTYLKFTNQGTIEVWRNNILTIRDLIEHIHSGVVPGSGVSGPPIKGA